MSTSLEDLAVQLEEAVEATEDLEQNMSNESAATAEVASVVAKMRQSQEQISADLDATHQAIQTQDARVQEALNGYDEALATAHEALKSGGANEHALTATIKTTFTTALETAFKATLNGTQAAAAVAAVPETDLRKIVRDWDKETEAIRTASTADLELAQEQAATAWKTVEEKRKIYEGTAPQMKAAIANVTELYEQLESNRKAFEAARDEGSFSLAIIHLQAYVDTRDQLTGSVQVSPADMQYDLDDENSAATVLAAWTTARDEYSDALSVWYQARLTQSTHEMAVATAERDAAVREPERLAEITALIDAAIEQARSDAAGT